MRLLTVRVYGPLNDFLPPSRRQATLVCALSERASAKDVVESLGVPHPEIELLLVNGRPVGFDYVVRGGERVAVYPPFRSIPIEAPDRLSPPPQDAPRFVADVHLGRLAAYLRLAGFDVSYRGDATDPEIALLSAAEDRTVLTRDVGLLKRALIVRGIVVRATRPAVQLVEVLQRFDLVSKAAPFSRCLRCNDRLERVEKAQVAGSLPERTRSLYERFSRCPSCERVYWPGSHFSRMQRFLAAAFREVGA